MFKSKFPGWDDVLAVDYTRSADQVFKKPVVQQVGFKDEQIMTLLYCISHYFRVQLFSRFLD